MLPRRGQGVRVLLDLVLTAFEPPQVNPKLTIAGRTIYPDLRWPAQRLCVEADSRAWHAGELAQAHDAERQAILEAHGERIIRVTWKQTTSHPRQTIARLTAAGAPLLAQGAST